MEPLELVDEMEPLQPRQPAPPPKLRLTSLQQKALDLFRPGEMSYRELGRQLGVGKDKAGDLIRELRELGYLAEEEEENQE